MTRFVQCSDIEMNQICMIALIGVFLSLLIKDKNPTISVLLSVACGILILFSVSEDLSEIISFTEDMSVSSFLGNEIFPLLLKVTGIAYLVDFSADVCRDAGENGIAKKLEIAGKITIISLSLPVVTSLFEKIKDVFM